MNRLPKAYRLGGLGTIALFLCLALPAGAEDFSEGGCLTNLALLRRGAGIAPVTPHTLRLEATVCAISHSGRELVLADNSGADIVRLDSRASVRTGDQVLLTAPRCLARLESRGIALAATPLIDNDGLHGPLEKSGKIRLEPGRVAMRVEWFNASRGSALKLAWRVPGGAKEKVPREVLWRQNEQGVWTNGLSWRCYEGSWETLPKFVNLPVAAAGSSADLNIDLATRKDFVGLVFDGCLDVPRGGEYEFSLTSDDGARLFLEDNGPNFTVVSAGPLPSPQILKAGAVGAEFRWVESSGTVRRIMERDDGVEVVLSSAEGPLRVWLPMGERPPGLPTESEVVVRGLARDTFRPDGSLGFGLIEVVSAGDVGVQSPGSGGHGGVLTTAAEVEQLSSSDAERGRPVRMSGVITCDAPELYYGNVIQDRTRGIYFFWSSTNLETGRLQRRPRFGEFWEVEGVSAPGNFAPDIEARRMRYLGEGQLPAPVVPAWDQLLNGSLDTQFVELLGIITDADTNGVMFLTHGGKIRIDLEPSLAAQLLARKYALARLCGCLLAVWDSDSRQVKLGEIRLANGAVTFEARQPADPFNVPQKNVDDLLRFDVAAGSFQRVKIAGQILEKRGEEFFLVNGLRGLHFVPREPVDCRPGDQVEVVGIPELDGPSPVLFEAMVRRTGFGPLPDPVRLKPEEISRPQNDALRVRFDASLNGVRAVAGETLLDLQAGGNYFSARLRLRPAALQKIEPGSRVELTGVFAALSAPRRMPGRHLGSFEVLVSSPDDIRVVARPPWWTLRRLLAVTGALFAVLVLAALWITQLRRRVEERTRQLRHEISERERAEQLRIVQEERTRIAQDLHDDLGSSLTEIGVLASVGSRSSEAEVKSHDLFGAIGDRSRRLVAALDALVWAIDPKENTLQSLADYLAGYVENYLSTNGLTCRFRLPDDLPLINVEGKQRHELFLVVKEALHNIVRHAHATEVEFHLAITAAGLEVVVRDNGGGFDPSAKSGGYGLRNFAGRMARLGGECALASKLGGGTTVKLKLPLRASPATAFATDPK